MSYIEGLVSVIIPTYKRADKLKRAIDSVLRQTYSNLPFGMAQAISDSE